MIDPQRLRDDPDRIRQAIREKGYDATLVDQVVAADKKRRNALTALQELQQTLNEKNREIGPLMKEGRRDAAQPLIEETSKLKEQLKSLEAASSEHEETFEQLLLEIPNPAHPSVPVGKTEADNEVAETWGDTPSFAFEPLPHWELADRLKLIDFERGAKVTGAGFPFYIGFGARLQRGLIQFFLDQSVEAGYVEIQPPLLVNEASGIGTGQLPDKEGQMYVVERDELFPIPTAEVPITNFHREEILDANDLPRLYAAYTPCFRREAGSYGKDVRGLNRLHQFDKVELVRIVEPASSYDHLEALREDAERLLKALELPYRRLVLSTGEMGTTQAKTYDLEVWSPGQDRWLEVSSISNFEAYQARRAKIRFRSQGDRKPEFVHTLNGSALALPRIVAALLETFQEEDGSIALPKALHSYVGVERIGPS